MKTLLNLLAAGFIALSMQVTSVSATSLHPETFTNHQIFSITTLKMMKL